MKHWLKRCLCLVLCLLMAGSGTSVWAEELVNAMETETTAAAEETPAAPNPSEEETPAAGATAAPVSTNLPEAEEIPAPEATELPLPTAEIAELETTEEEQADDDGNIEEDARGDVSEDISDISEAAEDCSEDSTPDIAALYALFAVALVETSFVVEDGKLISYLGSETRITLPEDVKIVGNGAFSGNETLTEIILPEGVTAIEENAFSGCSGLTLLRIPESVTEIAELNSLLAASPQVRIEVCGDSYAENYLKAQGIACVRMDGDAPEAVTPESIVPCAQSITIGLKEQVSVAGWSLLPEGAQDSVTYSVKSTKIATVSEDGVVTGKRVGTTKIILTSGTGLTASMDLTVMKSPTSITLSADRRELGQGETAALSYVLSKKSAGVVSFESLHPEVASVDENGIVTALASGTATIRATTYNGKSKTVSINVYAAPTELNPAETDVKIGAGDGWTLGYSLDAGAAGAVSFDSSDETIASVDADGKIRAHAQGEAQITITAYNGVSGTCRVEVTPAPTAFGLSAERSKIGVGEQLQLAVSIAPEGTMGTVQYKSSSTKIATVSADGLVTAKRTGTVTITGTTYNGLKSSVKLTVCRAPSSVTAGIGKKILGVGESTQLSYTLTKNSAGAVYFESLHPEIASVSQDGMLTALQTGAATIVARSYNGKTGMLNVTVAAAPQQVIPSVSAVSIGAGDCWTLGYSFNENAAGSVRFSSSDERVATVSDAGVIHAISEGTAQITITAHNGVAASCEVSVVAAPSAIAIQAEKTELGIGEKLKLNAMISPEGTLGTLSWKSGKTSIATVDADGVVTARRAGTATITVSTYNNVQASIKLTVKKAPTSVSIQAERTTLGVGETAKLSYTLSKNSAGAVSFESLNPELLELSPSGEMRALAEGTAMIRATTYNGKKRTASIVIRRAPEALYLSLPVSQLGVGDQCKLSYSLSDESAGAVSYESSDPAIATVDAGGTVTAHSVGSVEIRAAAYNGVGDTCMLTVVPAPTDIDLNLSRTTVGLKEPLQLEPRLLPEGSAGSLKYQSSKTSVVSVSSSGVLTAKKIGSATITVSSYNGVSRSFKVQVVRAASGLKLSCERSCLAVGEETVFVAKVTGTGAYSFASSDPQILTIDPVSGVAKALAAGKAEVSAKTYNGKSDRMEVIVVEAPTGMRITPAETVIGMGDAAMVHAELEGAGIGSYSLASSDENIVTVDADGKLKAVGMGSAEITATAYNGVSATAQVRVIEPIGEVSISNLEQNASGNYVLSMNYGESFALEMDLGAYSSVSFSYAANNKVVSVSEDGCITAKRKGVCELTVCAYSGAAATVEISVDGVLDMTNDVNIIMHAMGAVDGYNYTNSREAFLQNYAKGSRMFEIDLQYSSDGELVLWHNWNSNRINSSVKAGYVPTEQQFANMKINDRYDSLTYRDLLELMDEYPDMLFFIDNKKTAAADVRKQFNKMVSVAKETGHSSALNRMVIMIYNQSMYDVVSEIYPFTNYVLMGYKYFSKAPTTAQVKSAMEFCVAHDITMISMWDYWWKESFGDMAKDYGLTVNLHTIDSLSDARKYASQGVKLITSNTIIEGTV